MKKEEIKKENYMFQYFNGDETKEDTGLIPLERGLELWDIWRSDFIRGLKQGLNVEVALWKNCENETDYSETVFWFNNHTEYSNGRFYENKPTYLDEDLRKLTGVAI